jgi:hypothetical protein
VLAGMGGAAKEIAALERTLDANLATLSATGRFDEAITTLAAAAQLLSARATARSLDDIAASRRHGKAA